MRSSARIASRTATAVLTPSAAESAAVAILEGSEGSGGPMDKYSSLQVLAVEADDDNDEESEDDDYDSAKGSGGESGDGGGSDNDNDDDFANHDDGSDDDLKQYTKTSAKKKG